LLPNVATSKVTFPEGYKASFRKYPTINFPATKQVRYYCGPAMPLQFVKHAEWKQ